jgi:hypothetical protein
MVLFSYLIFFYLIMKFLMELMNQQTLQHAVPSGLHETAEDDVSGIFQAIFVDIMLVLQCFQKVPFSHNECSSLFFGNWFILDNLAPLSPHNNYACFNFLSSKGSHGLGF